MNDITIGRTPGNADMSAANPSTTGRLQMNLPKRSFSRPLVTISINIEGISRDKEVLLSDMCKTYECDFLLVQETHRGILKPRPNIEGMRLILERPHDQYGSAVFARPYIDIVSASLTERNNTEILTVRTPQYSVTSLYKPPESQYVFTEPDNLCYDDINFVLGDFNCQSIAWGYKETSENGTKLETWAEANDLQLIHDPKLPCSFNSGRWKRGYNPDNIFVSSRIASQCEKSVGDPIPRTQHRPIVCTVSAVVKPEVVPLRRRFNFKKANWTGFREIIDREIANIPPQPDMYDSFVKLVQQVSRKMIPRGCRTHYIAGLSEEAKPLLERYQDLFDNDPFAEDTLLAGEELMSVIAENRKTKWCDLVESLDMQVNSRRAWKFLKNINGDATKPKDNFTTVTADQVATNLLLNGKTCGRKYREPVVRDVASENHFLEEPFTMSEITAVITSLKTNRSPGIDEIRVEQLKNLGKNAMQWLLSLMNMCVSQMHIPKAWRKARVAALLKPGKDPNDPKNFRPVSLLCHTYKILERLILNRIGDFLDQKIIPQQAGFRSGKSCCGQVLNLTQHIEDGFERKQITGVAFVDLTAAYDTVNHRRLLGKVYSITKDYQLTSMIGTFLHNRRFFVSLQGKKSRWRNQRNGLPQGSVLAPALYNIYTNDQPLPNATRQYIYADDTAVAAQGRSFEEVEQKLTMTLNELSQYYDANHLKPNPAKTQVCAFHLNNREAGRELNVRWRGDRLQHCPTPKYLGVILDRTLTFKAHCIATRGKVSARNNIIRKLTSRCWGANPNVLRTSALALSVSAAEYAAPVWNASSHAKKVDIAVNDMARIVTGCLKPTPVHKLYPIIGIAPPSIRRDVAADAERTKQETDPRHPLHGHQPAERRLRSRKSFLSRTRVLDGSISSNRVARWEATLTNPPIPAREELAPGGGLHYTVWKTLNRIRVEVPKCKTNMQKWGLLPDEENILCPCGAVQDPGHLLICPRLDQSCTLDDLLHANDKAISVANFWKSEV